MSRFIDNLKRLSQATPQSIGFRATQAASPRLKIQLVASLTQQNAESLTGYVAGADAGLLRISGLSSGTRALPKLAKAMPDIPWGGWLPDSSQGDIRPVTRAGADFIVFPASSTPLATRQDEESGKIIAVKASLGEGLLRAINELPVDAVLVGDEPAEGQSLTWEHLILFRRIADLLVKPLLVPAPPEITGDELGALWSAGVSGVIIEVTAEQPRDRLRELRQVIDKLAFPSPPRRGKIEPRLSLTIREPDRETAEEEEDERE